MQANEASKCSFPPANVNMGGERDDSLQEHFFFD